MIDFRYHIVSLISVFLALAVGIILGAGPLKETIGDSLTGQVELLRAEKEEIRAALDSETAARTNVDEYVSAASKRIAKGTLEGRRIGVIQLGEVSDDRFESIEQQVTYAGGTVEARIQLNDSWTNSEQAPTRISLANTLKEMIPEDKQELQSEKVLAASLMVALAEKNPTNADALSTNAELALSVLEEAKLVNLVRYSPVPVDAIIIIDGSNVAGSDETDADFTDRTSLQMNVAEEAARSTEGVVVATTTVAATDLVSAVRASSSMVKLVATVSGINTPVGQVNTPLALSAAIGKKVGHFGYEATATALVPAAVVLPEPDRSIEEAETDDSADSDEDENSDGESAEGGN